MKTALWKTGVLTILLVCVTVTVGWVRAGGFPEFEEFEDVSMRVVYSATDEDAQMIITGGSDDPIRKVWIFGPGDRLFAKAQFKDKGNLGQADFEFESPEPLLEDLMQAYPAGSYDFIAQTVGRERLFGTVELTYCSKRRISRLHGKETLTSWSTAS